MTTAVHDFNCRDICDKCGRHWTDIRNVTTADIGLPDIACIGTLTVAEYGEIRRRTDAEDERIARAMGDLA